MKNILFLDNVNKGNGVVSIELGITYFLDIILHLHIVYILKGNCFFVFVFLFLLLSAG